MVISPVLIALFIIVLYVISSIKILAEYERGVIFRLGKLLPRPKGPGVILVFAPIDRIVRVGLRTVVFEVPPQDVITRDNVSVKVSAFLKGCKSSASSPVPWAAISCPSGFAFLLEHLRRMSAALER